MTKYYINPFAIAGDKMIIPDSSQPDGSVSYQTGFGPDYALNRNYYPQAKPVPRSGTNELFFDVTENIQQYQQHGTPNFISSSDNGGTPFPYDAQSRVLSGGIVYESLVDGNTSTPPSANWVVASITNYLTPDQFQQRSPIFATDLGSTNSLQFNPSPAYSGYQTSGVANVLGFAAFTNTSRVVVITVNSIATIQVYVKGPDGYRLPFIGEIVSGALYQFSLTNTIAVLENPSPVNRINIFSTVNFSSGTPNQTVVASGTLVPVRFNNVITDVPNWWDPVNFWFKPDITGFYKVRGNIVVTSAPDQQVFTMTTNIPSTLNINYFPPSGAGSETITIESPVLFLNGTTNTVQLDWSNSSSTTPCVIGGGPNATYFTIEFLGL